MKSLTFAFPEVHPGPNTTIRKGTLKLYDFPPGEDFEICDADYGTVRGRARVVESVAKHFSALTEKEISAHHLAEHLHPQGRREGLLHLMQYHYPDFKEDDVVTVITFEIQPPSGDPEGEHGEAP
jgi:hypothetical protein